MLQRLSRHTLFQLRNDIPIDLVISDLLHLPTKISDGFLRFLCPLCNEFNTATNPKTNLARCFRCKRNFNTIDMVMIVRCCNFVEAVKFLLALYEARARAPRQP